MQAIQIVKVGEPLQLTTDVPIPKAPKGQLVVQVKYASINPMDAKLQARNAFNLPLPITVGWDLSGTVSEVGEGVTKFKVGDEVFGMTLHSGGGFAQYALVNEHDIAKRVNLPADVAGGSGVVFGTVWDPLFVSDDLNKRKGQTIFIAGGGGGIGHLAIQLAKHCGLRVITSASKPESLKLAKESGADDVIDYSKTDVVAEVLKLTNGTGVDIAFDPTCSTPSMTQSAKVVKNGGTWIRVGGLEWNATDEEARAVCQKNNVEPKSGDLARYWKPDYRAKHGDVAQIYENCDKLYANGISTKITKIIPFDLESVKVAEANGNLVGKYVIKVL